MMTLKEFISENGIEEEISAERAFEEGQRVVADNIGLLLGICLDSTDEEKFLNNIGKILEP